MDLAAVPRCHFIARRIHHDLACALLLRHVTGGIGRREDLLDAAAVARELDQADAGSHGMDAIPPHETVLGHLARQIVGNLPALGQRASRQQQRKFIATHAGHRVRIAHGFAHQLRHFAQQAVAGLVAAGVVHGLEVIQVDEAQHMRGFTAPHGLE